MEYKIPEGAVVNFVLHGIGSPEVISTVKAYSDITMHNNEIVKIGNELFCTDLSNAVKEVNKNKFEVSIWIQDALAVVDDELYQSASDLD